MLEILIKLMRNESNFPALDKTTGVHVCPDSPDDSHGARFSTDRHGDLYRLGFPGARQRQKQPASRSGQGNWPAIYENRQMRF